jgi:hypothetical protein
VLPAHSHTQCSCTQKQAGTDRLISIAQRDFNPTKYYLHIAKQGTIGYHLEEYKVGGPLLHSGKLVTIPWHSAYTGQVHDWN